MLRNRYVLGFSLAAFLYVATESAIYVWMPTYLLGYDGPATILAAYALTLFFVLRSRVGTFSGHVVDAALELGSRAHVVQCDYRGMFYTIHPLRPDICRVPAALFRVIYVRDLPYAQLQRHQLPPKKPARQCGRGDPFFTAAGAAVGPLVMGVISDLNGGDPVYGFIVATVFASILAAGLLLNWLFSPVSQRLAEMEQLEESLLIDEAQIRSGAQ